MLQIGQYNTLKVLRNTKVSLFLGDEEHDVLLPNKYVPKEYFIGDEMTVFVYLDHEERPVATTLKPYVKLDEFAHLKGVETTEIGAFPDWGVEKHLFVACREPVQKWKPGACSLDLFVIAVGV